MKRTSRWAAALAAQVTFPNRFAAQQGHPEKRTHKLPPMSCVMWLPDYGGYLKALNLCAKSFTVSATPEGAMRLDEDQATDTGRALIDATGVRVQLRPFYEQPALSLF